MIPKTTILALITTLITLFFQPNLLTQWNALSKNKKEKVTDSIQEFVEKVKKELQPKTRLKTEPPKDFEGNSDDVANWCRRMTLYFNNQNIDSEWEKIEFALSKITRGRENRAQKWADTAIKAFIPFQIELRRWREDNKSEPDEEKIQQFSNKPPFNNWKEMTGYMADFFITNESVSNAIENLK